MDLGPHAGFIIASYATVAVIIGGLIVWLIADGRYQQRMLAELDARGVKRRSSSANQD